jgi:hypothetical protein
MANQSMSTSVASSKEHSRCRDSPPAQGEVGAGRLGRSPGSGSKGLLPNAGPLPSRDQACSLIIGLSPRLNPPVSLARGTVISGERVIHRAEGPLIPPLTQAPTQVDQQQLAQDLVEGLNKARSSRIWVLTEMSEHPGHNKHDPGGS